MKKFDLIEALKGHGFEHSDNAFGCDVFSLTLTKKTDVLWYGVQEFHLEVRVTFNPSKTACTVNYFDGGNRPFKSKTHLSDKRCWNAIRATVEGKGYEMKEVA